ncbi:MAG: outer membrane lipoprotein carrier protein LolA, partial [Thermodesulfobacteriota bacterium]|nr:outer membrane lipoprotein carrier protein LolA [Thermodesulfobacteriota bacterium]
HFLRLDQKTPTPETIIANEEAIWWYIPEKKLVYNYPTGEFGQELKLLSDIFSGLAQVGERFKVALLGVNSKGEHRVELRPDPPWQEVDHITLAVTSGNHIRVVDIHNMLGSITRLTLGDLTVRNKLEEDVFRFVVPEGVHVVLKGSKAPTAAGDSMGNNSEYQSTPHTTPDSLGP